MAIMIPEAISKFDTQGEGIVYNYLKDNLSNEYIVFYNLRSEITGLVDFIIVCPSGILGIEVKDWSAAYINSCNTNEVYLNNPSNPVEEYPVKTAQNRIWNLVNNQIKKIPSLIATLRNGTFRYSGVAWYVNLDDSELEQKLSWGKKRNNNTIQQLTSDDFSRDAQELINACFKYIGAPHTRDLTVDECNAIKKFILQEKKIYVTFDDLVIELDKQQMEYAKKMEYGQYILRGAGGTGKTVRLIGRAIYLAETHPDFNILFVTSKKPLATLVYPNFQIYSNITLVTKHDLFKKNYLVYYSDISFKFNVILIDELQDFSKEAIELIKLLLYAPDKSHFIGAIDGAQNTYNNQYNLLEVADGSMLLTQNYRNGDKILSYIQSIGQNESSQDNNSSSYYNYYANTISHHVGKGEIYTLDFTSSMPVLLNLILSFQILSIIKDYPHLAYEEMAIINIGYKKVLEDISKSISDYGIPTDLEFCDNNSIKLINSNSSKGLEFTLVILLVNSGIPNCEQSKILACTRAREYLYVIYY